MRIDNESLEGKIGELARQYNVSMIVFDTLVESLRVLDFIDKNFQDVLGCDIETQGLEPIKHDMLGLAIATKGTSGVYINVRGWEYKDIVTMVERFNKLRAKKIFHNSIFDSPFVGIRYGIKLQADIDTLIISHAVLTDRQYYSEGLGLKDLTAKYLPFGDYEEELTVFKKDYCKANKMKVSDFTYDLIPDSILIPYAIFDVISTLLLYKKFTKVIKNLIEGGWTKLQNVIDIKHKANKYYIDAKIRGILVDRAKVMELHKEWSTEREVILKELLAMKEIKKAESIIYRDILKKAQENRKSILPLSRCRKLKKDSKFNFNSNQHKQILFFKVMGLEVVEKTDTGSDGCGAKTIEHYGGLGLEVFKTLDRYTKLNKGITSFLGTEGDNGLWNLCTEAHPYIHSTHNLCGTVSSRTTTYAVNLAQAPSSGELKKFKSCFKVEDDYNWISFDYSAMESRFSTVESQEPTLKSLFKTGMDMHSLTAFGVYKDKMELPQYENFNDEIQEIISTKYKKTYRQSAKTISFGVLYGMGDKALSETLKISKKEAKGLIDKYYEENPYTAQMIKNNKEHLFKYGYCENRFGSRIYLRNAIGNHPDAKTKNWKAIGEHRFITNWMVQGGCAIYMYRCMISFFEEIESLGLDVSLLMTIYDSFMVRVHKSIDPDMIGKLFYKHFARELDGVLMDIEAFMSSDGTWYTYEDVSLSHCKGEDFKPIIENKEV